MKIAIKSLEKKLGKKLKRNLTVLGIDSASTAGMALLKVNSRSIDFTTQKLKFGTHKKGTPINSKLDTGIKAIQEYIAFNIHKPMDLIVIENAYLNLNKYTYGLLRMLSGIFYCEFSEYSKDIVFYYPTEHRKITGFDSKKMKGDALKKLVVTWVEYLGFGKLSHDEADAIMLALAGLVIQPPVQQALEKKKKVKAKKKRIKKA